MSASGYPASLAATPAAQALRGAVELGPSTQAVGGAVYGSFPMEAASTLPTSGTATFPMDSTQPALARENSENAAVSSTLVPVFDVGTACGEVVVDSPETQSDKIGIQRFTTYLVSGTLSGPSFTSRKRYSDFVWFRTALVALLPGVFIPFLPPKQQFGRFDAAFVEDRRLSLQQFLRRLLQRPEICIGLPVVLQFLTSTREELEDLKLTIDSRSMVDSFAEYEVVFADILANHPAPQPDQRFALVKLFLEKHVPLLKAAQVSTLAMKREQASLAGKMTDLERALNQLVPGESKLLENAGAVPSQLRDETLGRLQQSTGIEDVAAAKPIQLLSASLQREIEDCLAAQEALFSIELLQRRLFEGKNRITSDSVSWANLKREWLPHGDSNTELPHPDALSSTVRKRDKMRESFRKMNVVLKDTGAKAGINTERRLSELDDSMRHGVAEVAALEAQIIASSTVLSATEIPNFLQTKVAGCHWTQVQFAGQRAAMHRELVDCWKTPSAGNHNKRAAVPKRCLNWMDHVGGEWTPNPTTVAAPPRRSFGTSEMHATERQGCCLL